MKSTSTGATPLIIAAQNGHAEIVAKLLAQGADVNAAASDGSTALMLAAQNGHTETVSALLLRKDINVDAKISAYRLTALFLAAQNGHAEIVAKLLARGADVNAVRSDGSTALMLAAQNGHTEIVSALLSRDGIDVNAAASDGATALMLAAQNGHTETVAELLAERTDLMYVAQNGRAAVELSTKRANVNAVKKSSGYTALMFAVQNGHAEIVAKLLAQGADFNARSSDGSTALMLAAENGTAKIVAELLNQGADVSARASDGSMALMLAAQNGRTKIVARLLARGADVNAAKLDGGTSLMLAAQNGHTKIVDRLLARGADVNAATSKGGTALMVAAQNDHTEIVSALLSRDGINVNAAASNGYTALILAAQNGHTEIVSALLSRDGINVNAAASDGATALILAAQNGHTEIVSALLSRDGVDWQIVQDQLSHPELQELNEEVSLLLAVIIPDKKLPDKELRNSIIKSFNRRHDNKINQENNDILGAGPKAYKTLKDLKSWHKRYLTDPDLGLGLSENKAEISANKRFFYLLNHQGARQEALARNDLITALVSESASLAINSGVFGDEDALGRVRELTPEDFYTLTTKIIDSSGKDESVIPKLQALSLVAALQKDIEDHPRTEISPASAARMKGQAGLCIVS